MSNYSENKATSSEVKCGQTNEERKSQKEKADEIDSKILPEDRDCVIEFYRSKIQSLDKNNYGSYDTEYDGSFGFDRFSSIVAEGTIEYYEKITNLHPINVPVSDFKEYRYSYLSIAPNKSVKLFVKAKQSIKKHTGSVKIRFKSSNCCIEFANKKQEIDKTLTIDNGTATELKITSKSEEITEYMYMHIY